MKQVVFIHGGDDFSRQEDFLAHLRTTKLYDPLGQGSDLWTKKLRSDLGEDFELYQLAMPNKQNADYLEWQIWFERHISFWHDGVVLVGWSLGAMFLVKYLSENSLPFKYSQVYLLAGPCGHYSDDSETGNDCGTFQFTKETLTALAPGNNIQIWHSTDDFVVPYSHALEFSEVLTAAKLVTFTDRNHFLQQDFPELVADIKALR